MTHGAPACAPQMQMEEAPMTHAEDHGCDTHHHHPREGGNSRPLCGSLVQDGAVHERASRQAVTALEREIFVSQFEQRYEDLRSDPAAWQEIVDERNLESSARRDASR